MAQQLNRAYSTLEIKAAAPAAGQKRTFTGIASTPSADRMGDIVEPKGAEFKLPIPLLWQHNASKPIGWVTEAKVTSSGIEIKGEVAEVTDEGDLKQSLDYAWQAITSGLVRGLSIGFNAIESARIEGTYSYRFIKWEWLELSAVTIPANSDCSITAIKSADMAARAATGRMRKGVVRLGDRPGAAGLINHAPSRRTASEGATMATKSVAETIREYEAKRAATVAAAEALMTKSLETGETFDDAQEQEYDELRAEIAQIDKHLKRLRDHLKLAADSATEADGKSADAGTASRNSAGTAKSGTQGGGMSFVRKNDPEDKFQGQSFVRMQVAKAIARMDGVSVGAVAEARWGKSNPQLVQVIKANEVGAGGTASGQWGSELVTIDGRFNGDFIEFLYAATVFDKLALRAVPENITIKGQDGAATGFWVGQNKAIPVTPGDFMNVTLTSLDVAAISVISKKLVRESDPSAEMLVRDNLQMAITEKVDTTFLSAVAAAAGVSPAGILNGLTAITSAGTSADNLRTDVKALYAPFLAAYNAADLTFVMNPKLAKSIALFSDVLAGAAMFPDITTKGGQLLGDPVVTGDNVNPAHLILLKPSDIYKVGDRGVQVSVSEHAMIEMSSAPTGDTKTPAAASQMLNSMFQTESIAFKVVRPLNWAKRRASAVAYVNGANYGG